MCLVGDLTSELPLVAAIELPCVELLNVAKKALSKEHSNSFDKYFGGSVSKAWIEEKFSNFDLFASSGLIIIYDCESISKDDLSLLKEMAESSSRNVILFFNKDLSKKWSSTGLKVKKPPFWEGEKIFKELLNFYSLKLEPEVLSLTKDYLNANVFGAFSLIEALIPFKGQNISSKELKSFLPNSSIDQFELVHSLNIKNLPQFYLKLSQAESFEEVSSLTMFSISHLLKYVRLMEMTWEKINTIVK